MGNAAVSLEDLLYRAHKFIFDKPLATRSPHLSIEILIVYKRQRYIRKSLCIRPEHIIVQMRMAFILVFLVYFS